MQKDLKASPFILRIIENGYFLPFHSEPHPFYAKNNLSSLKRKEFVGETISELLVNKCIEEVSDVPYCINPLTVAEVEKSRLVLDLRNVNMYLDVNKLRYENLKAVAELFEPEFYFVAFDLKADIITSTSIKRTEGI